MAHPHLHPEPRRAVGDPGQPESPAPPGATPPRTLTEKLLALRDPFPIKDLEWRILRSGLTRDHKPWAIVSAYVDNRAIVERLDRVMGPANWRDEFKEWNAGTPGVLCGVSLRLDGEWITKWDGAEQPREKGKSGDQLVAVKGGFSGAEKRAASKWGIGRYLYDAGDLFAEIRPGEGGRFRAAIKQEGAPPVKFTWDPPALPPEFLPVRAREAAEQRIAALRRHAPQGGAR